MFDVDSPRDIARRHSAQLSLSHSERNPAIARAALMSNWPFTPDEQQTLVDRVASDPRFITHLLATSPRLTAKQRTQLEKLRN
jgi:hypothetical protein